MKNELKKLKEKDRDLWYKKMGDRIPIGPDDERWFSWMDYFDEIDYYNMNKE